MNSEFHLQKIEKSADSIRTLYFRPPGTFSNSMLRPHDITSLIRDADDSEAVLFTLAQTNAVAKVAAAAELIKTANISSNLDSSSGSPSRSTKQQSTNGAAANSYNVEMLCDTVETISQTYPMSGITEKLQKYRERYSVLCQSIREFDQVVEAQREQIKVLSDELKSSDSLTRTTTEATTPSQFNLNEDRKPSQLTVEEVHAQMAQLRKEIESLTS